MSKIVLAEQSSAPDTPGSGKVAVFVDSNGDLAWKDSAGNVNKIASAGGYTLTVPATGTAALLATANTFTAQQKINYNSAPGLILQNSGVDAISLYATGDKAIIFFDADCGTSYGPYVQIGRNSNASTSASGWLAITNKAGSIFSIWVDAAEKVRFVKTTTPTHANDTAGAVLGDQTSSLDSKDVIGDPIAIDQVLAAVQAGADAVRRFTYKSGAYNGEEFSGLVTDYAPRYGKDRDAEHPAGKSLNEITIIGDLLLAVANLSARVAALEAAE